jgi:hypothetical protein
MQAALKVAARLQKARLGNQKLHLDGERIHLASLDIGPLSRARWTKSMQLLHNLLQERAVQQLRQRAQDHRVNTRTIGKKTLPVGINSEEYAFIRLRRIFLAGQLAYMKTWLVA